MKKLFLTLLLILLLAYDAEATRYWAATTGSDANSCAAVSGTSDPGVYRTYSGAASCSTVSGDEVYVKPGTYTTNATITFNLSSGVTIRGSDPASANWPVLQPTGSSLAGINFNNITRSDITIKFIRWDFSNATSARSCVDTSSDVFLTNLLVEDFECKGPPVGSATDTGSAFRISNNVSGTIVRRGKIHRWHSLDGSPGAHGFYWSGDSGLVDEVEVTDLNGYGIQFFTSTAAPDNNVVRNSRFHNFSDRGPVFIQGNSNGNTFHNNEFFNWNGPRAVNFHGTNTKFINNAIYEASAVDGILISGCGGTCTIANNLIIVGGTAISGSDADVTQTTNRTTGVAADLMLDAGNGDFSLKELSAAIDGGTSIAASGQWPGSSGRFVGSAPDQGAREACIRLSGVVENATPTIYSVTYSCPSQAVRNGVGVQTPTVANWAMVVAGSGATENSAAITGTARVDATLNVAVTTGQSLTDAMTRSTVPTLTDNHAIGDPNGTLWTNYFLTKVRTHSAASGTNNVGGAGTAAFEVTKFRCLSWYGNVGVTSTSPHWVRLQDSNNCPVGAGRLVPVAVSIFCTNVANCDPQAFDWHSNRNGGAYSALTNTATATAIAYAGINAPAMSDGEAIPACLFASCTNYTAGGKVIARQASEPTVDLPQNGEFNAILLLKTDAATAVGDVDCVQPAKTGLTTASVTQTKTVCIEIVQPASGF